MILKFKSYRTTKNRLWNLVKPMSQAEFSQLINPIIAEARDLEPEKAKHQRLLQSNEVVAFMDKIGGDLNEIGKIIVLDTLRTNKRVLRQRIPHLSDADFSILINTIIQQNRKMVFGKAKYRKYLMADEVKTFLNWIGEDVG